MALFRFNFGDDADKSINSNLTSITMRKDFYPSLNSTFYYEVCFQNAFDKFINIIKLLMMF